MHTRGQPYRLTMWTCNEALGAGAYSARSADTGFTRVTRLAGT